MVVMEEVLVLVDHIQDFHREVMAEVDLVDTQVVSTATVTPVKIVTA